MYKIFFELTPETEPCILDELHELTSTVIHGKTGFQTMTNVHVDCTQKTFSPCLSIFDPPSYVCMDVTWDKTAFTMEQVQNAMTWLKKHITEVYEFPYIVMIYTSEKT